jgi:hypothetical protein
MKFMSYDCVPADVGYWCNWYADFHNGSWKVHSFNVTSGDTGTARRAYILFYKETQ